MRNRTCLRALYAHQYRPFEDAHFEFGPSLNIICGPNARGKTSLLEAIYFLMSGFSFRTSRIADLIRYGFSHFHLEAGYQKHGVRHQLKVSCSEKERRVVDNTTYSSSLNTLPGILPGVVMTPDDIAIIKGSPQIRRDFLDTQIAQVDPLYFHHLNRYQRAMRQRNALLKLRQTMTIESWEHEMAHAASYIILQRFETVKDLQNLCRGYYSLFGEAVEQLELTYQTVEPAFSSADEVRKHLLRQYEKLRRRELELGCTLSGPHKDDLNIILNGKEARYYASEGQQRTCVAALRCAEWERIYREVGEKPLMLIDDFGMGLDAHRQSKLMTHLCTLGQVFLTTTSDGIASGLPEDLRNTITLER